MALQIALQPARIPLSAADAADPEIVRFANQAADTVLRRTVLDPVEARGFTSGDLSDRDVLATLAVQAGMLVRNQDGARPYELRRTAVDVLHRMQSTSGLDELRRSKQALEDTLAQRPPAAEEEALSIEDLVARIDAALSPYFN